MAGIGIEALKAKAGEPIGTSEWLLVDQPLIDRFADATGDDQFIHTDPARAAATPFGGTIAHGFLTLSLLSTMMARSDVPSPDGVKMAVNYGLNKVRFLAPVRSGSRIRTHFRLIELAEKRPGQFQETLEASVEIEGQDKPALVAEWIFQLFL